MFESCVRRSRVLLVAALLAQCVGAVAWAGENASAASDKLSTLRVPEGFVVERVAGPPLVERPMLAAFDDAGRLYVCDSAGVNLRGPELAKNPPHVIRRLEDTDGDGVFDTSAVFADKLVFPQGIEWHDGAVFCSSPPSFWRLEDTDGDGVADRREELATGFANTGVADDMHGASLGPDGRIYWCAGRFPHEIRRPGGEVIHRGTAPLLLRAAPDGSQLEVVCGLQGNAVGVAFTPEGDMFTSGTFLAPNAMGAGLRDAVVHCVDGAEYPVRDRTLDEHKRTGELLPPLAHMGVSASSDLMICRTGLLGEGSRGDLFSALFNMHKIVRHKLARNGATFVCRNEDFLVSSDADFHPTDVFEDADGSLLVIDTGGWFRIGCPTSQVAKPEVLGGIYRVRRANTARNSDPRGRDIAWDTAPPEELAKLVADERFAVRERAVARLAKRGEPALEALSKVVDGDAPKAGKCAAVWAMTRIEGEAARAAVRQALDNPDAGVRQAAARSAGLHRDPEALERLAQLVRDDAPAVRREAATALGRIGQGSGVPALLEGLRTVGDDRFLEHAMIFALIEIGDASATRVGLDGADSRTRRGALIALDQMDGGGLTPEVVVPLLDPANPLLQNTALWVIAHHADWAGAMLGVFRTWLADDPLDAARREALGHQLLAFAGDAGVQQLMAATAGDRQAPQATRLLVLELMGQAAIDRVPPVWAEALATALADEEPLVRQAVATLRGLPLDKRPVATGVVEQVNFAETLGGFGEVPLVDHFCARFSGTVRCPQDGTYTFAVTSDDGSWLYVDDQLVVDNGGSHAMREREGRIELAAGDHALRLEYVEETEDAGCILSWSFADHAREVIPREVLFHHVQDQPDAPPAAGLAAEYYTLGGAIEMFPDLAVRRLDAPLVRVALDAARPLELRVQAAAAVSGRLASIEPELFGVLQAALAAEQPPLVRLDAAEALGKARLSQAQLLALCETLGACGTLELPKLVAAFGQSHEEAVGRALVAALAQAPALPSVGSAALTGVLAAYPQSVQQAAEPLAAQLAVDAAQQQARLASLSDVLSGGEIQRGRDLFFGNQKAICATCHSVQGQGGKIGPDLSKIGAIRTPADLLEAIVLPSASFARGYEPFTVLTTDGLVQSGVIVRETAEAIHLFDTRRVEIRVPRHAIESLEQSPVSIMPQGMDEQLSRSELADLIAFLQSLR